MSAAKRVRNNATGYPYTKFDHCQQWVMPDGSREFTGWIERGDSEEADHVIARLEADIARRQAEIVKWQAIHAALLAEGGPIANA